MDYEFYHCFNFQGKRTTEIIAKTRLNQEAIRLARAYVNSFENTKDSFYGVKIDGNFGNIGKLASKMVCMDACLKDFKRRNDEK